MTDKPYVEIVADSISPMGHRLTTVKAIHHRPILAETNTHRIITKSSASSRAIPIKKQLAKFTENPAFPNVWASEQKGMQGGPPLEGDDLADAEDLFRQIRDVTADLIKDYVESHPIGDEEGAEEDSVRLHKSWLNRPLETFMWHTALWTATSWKNFFHQRAHHAAMPEFRLLAEDLQEKLAVSSPRELKPGEYHLPFVWDDPQVVEWAMDEAGGSEAAQQLMLRVSTARCARTSYETQDGKRDPQVDMTLYDRLATDDPMHAAPMEHVATPADWNERKIAIMKVNGRLNFINGHGHGGLKLTLPVVGNFVGWQQHRLEVEFDRSIASFS